MKMSESISELAKAMALAQPCFEKALKNKVNPFFEDKTKGKSGKYGDISAVWGACEKALHGNGFSILQPMRVLDSGKMVVETLLLHKSGEWVYGETLAETERPGPQGLGSAQTYARRYGLAAMVGVCPDEDDDAEGATDRKKPENSPKKLTKLELIELIKTSFMQLKDNDLSLEENKSVMVKTCVSVFDVDSSDKLQGLTAKQLTDGLKMLQEIVTMRAEKE